MPLEQLNEIESILRGVYDLACESGFDAILEAGPYCGHSDLGSLVPDDLAFYGKAMWVWLNHREVFEKAQIIFQVEHMPWWRKRNDLPETDPDMSQEAKTKLKMEISSLLKSQGRGKDCTVETLTRGTVDYFYAYPDDFVQNVVIHDEGGNLAPETIRPTMLIVFAYDREAGSLEMSTKLPKKLKEELEFIFADAILHWELGPHVPGAVYELNQLKDAAFDLKTDPADGLRVVISKMRLSAKNCGRSIHVGVDGNDLEDNIHRAIDETVSFEFIPKSEWNVTQVTLCFEFLPQDGRKHGQVTIDVTYPRSCTLRNVRPERVELIQKYLKKWGIDGVATPNGSPAPVGSEPAHDPGSGGQQPSQASI